MGEIPRRLVALFLIAVMSLAPGAAVAEDGSTDLDCNKDGRVDDFETQQGGCPDGGDPSSSGGLDCNRDGRIDDKERTFTSCPPPPGDGDATMIRGSETCDEGSADACPRPCDFNKDGVVGPREREQCSQVKDLCDTDQDGVLGEDERAACQEHCDVNDSGDVGTMERRGCVHEARTGEHPCDADGDGEVSEEEKRACEARFLEQCDANDDGRVDEFERRDCAAKHQEFERRGVSEECRAALQAQGERRRAFEESQREKRDAFFEEHRAEHEEFREENHTEEEWREFKEEQQAEHEEFEASQREARDAFEKENGRPEACDDDVQASGEQCEPDPADYERFKGLVDEDDRRFRDDLEERVKNFEERQGRSHDGNATDDAREARAAFEQSLEEARLKHRAHLEEMWERFRAKLAEACLGGPKGGDARALHEDVKDERIQCRIDFQARFDAFYEEHGTDASAWDDATTEAYIQLKTEVRGLLKECEARLHEAWKDEAKEQLRNQSREERFGHFEIESDGEGAGSVSGRFVAFDFETGSLILRDYTVQGLLVFEEFYAPHGGIEHEIHGSTIDIKGVFEDPDAEAEAHGHDHDEGEAEDEDAEEEADEEEDEEGSEDETSDDEDGDDASDEEDDNVTSTGGDEVDDGTTGAKSLPEGLTHLRVSIHDAPPGGIDLGCAMRDEVDMDAGPGGAEACFLTLADGAEVEEDEGDAPEGATHYRLALGDGRAMLRVHGPHSWDDDGTTLEFYGAASLLVPSENFVHEFANKHRAEINDAVEDGDVLAEVDVVSTDGDAVAETTELAADDEDVEVEVEEPEEGDGVTITVDAEGNAGKTAVFNVDGGLFDVEDFALVAPDDFEVTYWDIADDGTETEVSIEEADDLADVLDPSEDHPEYWIVLDADGLQVLVSFPHFSVHAVQIQSVPSSDGGAGAAPVETPFPGVLAAAAAVGAAVLATRRRGRP